MKEDLSTLTDASLPVRPNSRLFMCAEKAAAVYMSPFLFCGKTKKNKTKQSIKKEKEKRSTLARLGVNGGQKTSRLGCFCKIIHLAKDVVWTANHPVQGFLARKNTPLE